MKLLASACIHALTLAAALCHWCPQVPITLQHLPPADLDKHIPNPGMPRAHTAISKEQ